MSHYKPQEPRLAGVIKRVRNKEQVTMSLSLTTRMLLLGKTEQDCHDRTAHAFLHEQQLVVPHKHSQ